MAVLEDTVKMAAWNMILPDIHTSNKFLKLCKYRKIEDQQLKNLLTKFKCEISFIWFSIFFNKIIKTQKQNVKIKIKKKANKQTTKDI